MVSSMIEVCAKYHRRWQVILLGVGCVCIYACGIYALPMAFYL